MIVKAFEYGFLKARKRAVVNGQLNEIKQSQHRDRAIKDVLEFTMKYWKDQVVKDLKKIENNVVTNENEPDNKQGKNLISKMQFWALGFVSHHILSI